ncbi:MAG: rRNA maturation RNase YbeY [Candidatus Omnitrophica bacterium]|nr:rRNA maturation RNase YbeY [Candidatus Omnitrophota bacterium]
MSRAKLKAVESFEITNQQKVKRINIINAFILLKGIFLFLNMPEASVSVVFCDNKFIRRLNRKFFKRANATDVISFPLKDKTFPEYLGEVVVSVEEAVKAAELYKNTWQKELALYLIHGVLHTLGYNDIKKKERALMEKMQERILSKILKKHKKAVEALGN